MKCVDCKYFVWEAFDGDAGCQWFNTPEEVEGGLENEAPCPYGKEPVPVCQYCGNQLSSDTEILSNTCHWCLETMEEEE